MKILFFGKNGWIGSQFYELIKNKNHEIIISDIRVDNTYKLIELLDSVKPDRVISFIGRTHGENINTIDYLEQPGKLQENIKDNLYGPLSLGILCNKRNIHYTYLGTGCIFSLDNPELYKFKEEDDPNFFGSSYSIVKGFSDRFMKLISETTLNVRIRMPIIDKTHPRNFITKIISYEKICSYPNSMTVLPDLLPILLDMIENKYTGTINLVNPGYISHNEILELYRDIVEPNLKWENFTIEEQNKILLSKRSNNILDTTTLQKLYPEIPDIKNSLINIFKKYK